MKEKAETREKKIVEIRKRVQEGFYFSETVFEVIAEKFLGETDVQTNALTFKYD